MSKKVIVIGGGFGGLSCAALLAQDGYDVHLFERLDDLGGRARHWKTEGFTFDLGPSWYLMPEVFERYFSLFGTHRKEYYSLLPLDPYYKVFFGGGETALLTPRPDDNRRLFDTFEPNGGATLDRYIAQAGYKYDVAMQDFLYRDYRHIGQFFNRRILTEGLRLGVFKKLDSFVGSYFSDRRARQILEYAMVFLGTDPADAPAIYSIMSHVDLGLGVYFPEGGMAGAATGFAKLCREQGVTLHTQEEVRRIIVKNSQAVGIETSLGQYAADVVVSSADYHHVDTALLPPEHAMYSKAYWERRVVAPSMFIAYVGINRRLEGLEHHNLYFSKDWTGHFDAIFKQPTWPSDPCFYLSCISKTDPGSAPTGAENVFLLVPTAPGMADTDEQRQQYWDLVRDHVHSITGEDLDRDVVVKRIYTQRDFIADYHAFKGTALGLSHTLFQTAVFRPASRSKRVANLFFTGQYTHPGIGVPMVLIASELAAKAVKASYAP